MSSFLFYIPKYTLVIRFRHLDDISFSFGNSDLKVQLSIFGLIKDIQEKDEF